MDACVKVILCGLGRPVLGALSGLITGQIAVIDAQLATLSASLAVVNIAVVPIEAGRALADAALGAVLSVGDLVPVQVMTGCEALGGAIVGLNTTLGDARASANDFLDRANRSLAFRAELEFGQADLAEVRAQLQDLSDTIAEALAPGGCT